MRIKMIYIIILVLSNLTSLYAQNNCDTLFCDTCFLYNPFIIKLKHKITGFNGSDTSGFISIIDGKTRLKIIRNYENGYITNAIAKYNNGQIY
jgi:hypothetical protein